MTRRQFLALIVPLLLVLGLLVALFAVERNGGPGAPAWDSGFARHIRGSMAEEFVWGVEPEDRKAWEAYFNALQAWVQTYDPYAAIVPPWAVQESREASSGRYYGIGVRIDQAKTGVPLESLEIIGVKPGGPADEAGVRVGDRIIGVDGRTIPEICPDGHTDPLHEAIKGPAGTKVKMRLRGPDDEARTVVVTRARIDSGSVFGVRLVAEEPRTGYIRIHQFQASTAADFRAALEGLLKDGLDALVLDLRQNGGGLMEQAVGVADLFLQDGVIVRQRGRGALYSETYHARGADTIAADLPVAVLVGRGTASASEILAGALRDHRRGFLVGERTYGKFLVQMVEEVPMEYGTALFKRTTSLYETPNGHSYPRTRPADEIDRLAGIPPDIFVRISKAEWRRLARVFLNESFQDWNPTYPSADPKFVDRPLAAAVAALRGAPVTPLIHAPRE